MERRALALGGGNGHSYRSQGGIKGSFQHPSLRPLARLSEVAPSLPPHRLRLVRAAGASPSGADPPSAGPSAAESTLARARAYADAKRRGDSSQSGAPGSAASAQSADGSDPQLTSAARPTESGPVGLGVTEGFPRDEGEVGDMKSVPTISLMESSSIYEKQKRDLANAKLQQRQNNEPEKVLSMGPKDLVEVEIITRDGIVRKQLSRSEMSVWDERSKSSVSSKGRSQRRAPELKLSSADFAGLDFSDESKRSRGDLPAGLHAPADAPRRLPQVEIITSDAVKDASGAQIEGEVYKPKVATWGVFPRPRDISRTYGGGRTIRPGEALETEEQRKEREERTRRLLEEYSRLAGIKIDPSVKAECEKVLEEGEKQLDLGRLSAAVERFDFVLSKVPFKNDLHGKAALQKALCLDSMARTQEAKEMYERLAGHPNTRVKGKAQQVLFGFRAAENLKFSETSTWNAAWYRSYFDRVSSESEYKYFKATEEENDTLVKDAVTYGAVLLMPLALLAAVLVHRNL